MSLEEPLLLAPGDTLEIASLSLKVAMSEVLDDTQDEPDPPDDLQDTKASESHE